MVPEGLLPRSQGPATCLYMTQLSPVHTPHPNSPILPFSHLRLGVPSGVLPSGFPSKTLYTPLPSPIRATYPDHLILLDSYHPHKSGWGVQIMELLIMTFSSHPCYLLSLRPKYSPQHPILIPYHPTFLPQCQRPSSLWVINIELCNLKP
jgi:hypothetical protein